MSHAHTYMRKTKHLKHNIILIHGNSIHKTQ